MEPKTPFDAHIAWKMKFAPYVAQADGSFCVVAFERNESSPDEQPAPEDTIGRVIALPVVATVVDHRSHISTRATAILIRGNESEDPDRRPPLSVHPITDSSARAAISSLMRLKGRFPS